MPRDHPGRGAATKVRLPALFFKADPDYGRRVTQGLGLHVKQIKKPAAIPQEERGKATAK